MQQYSNVQQQVFGHEVVTSEQWPVSNCCYQKVGLLEGCHDCASRSDVQLTCVSPPYAQAPSLKPYRRSRRLFYASLFSHILFPAGLSNLYTLNVEKNFRKERYLRDHFDETFQCIHEIGCISNIFKNCKI